MKRPLSSAKTFGVGVVAKRSGVTVSAIHFYETKGLIKSYRNQGNQRRYTQDVLRRIAVIKAAQKVGVSLQDIAISFQSLPNERTPTKKDWDKLSKKWKADLDARIQQLEQLRDNLTDCIGCGCLSMQSCPLRNPDDTLSLQGNGAILLK